MHNSESLSDSDEGLLTDSDDDGQDPDVDRELELPDIRHGRDEPPPGDSNFGDL